MADHKIVRGLKRAQFAQRTGSNLETVRYYEKIGLLPEPPRSANDYRLYDQSHVDRLRFIMRGRELGFSIEEIRGLLLLVDGGDYTCAEINSVAVTHLNDIRLKIADLKKLAVILEGMASQCSKGQLPECPIIDALSGSG